MPDRMVADVRGKVGRNSGGRFGRYKRDRPQAYLVQEKQLSLAIDMADMVGAGKDREFNKLAANV